MLMIYMLVWWDVAFRKSGKPCKEVQSYVKSVITTAHRVRLQMTGLYKP